MMLVELCAGTASVSLWALARLRPLTGYMGSKRRDASRLCDVLELTGPPDEVVLVDGGPWGDVWRTLSTASGRSRTAEWLLAYDARGTLPEVWPSLLHAPPASAPERAAQYLCLQARAAGCIPVWWSPERERWESPSGSRTERAHQRGGCAADSRFKPAGSNGLLRIATLAERVRALDRIDWGRVTVIHGNVRDVKPRPGSRVYFDPPYLGAPRYAKLLPRDDVLAVAARHADVADQVVVSEAEPLPLDGWHHMRLRHHGKPEWLTCARRPRVSVQLPLLLGGRGGRRVGAP